MSKCALCKRTSEQVDFIDTAIQDLEAGWLETPSNRAYCPLCIRDRFDDIEKKEGLKEVKHEQTINRV